MTSVQSPVIGRAGSVRAQDTNFVVASYRTLLLDVRNRGLLRRSRVYYPGLFAVLVAALGGAAAGFILLGDSWYQLLIAAGLGILLTQFAFLAHEASHLQVFTSRTANEWSARTLGCLFVGMSYAMWVDKHSRHHQNPNVMGKDPDIHTGVLAFHEEGAATKRGLGALFVRHQGALFFPVILFLGISLLVDSLRVLLRRGRTTHRYLELSVLALRYGGYLTLLFLLLPAGMALAFLGVQLAVFGFYMGASFAPNHKGMPILPQDSRADFFTRQVLTARNIKGGVLMDLLMGGLNHQVEHHLFPDMARPQLRSAARIVRAYCVEHGIPYTETSLWKSYGAVVRYLNRVGLSAADPFECPLLSQFRRE